MSGNETGGRQGRQDERRHEAHRERSQRRAPADAVIGGPARTGTTGEEPKTDGCTKDAYGCVDWFDYPADAESGAAVEDARH